MDGNTNTASFKVPRLNGDQRGPPKYQIKEEHLDVIVALNCTSDMGARLLGCSKRTLGRRLREFGISAKEKFSSLPDNELDSLVHAIVQPNPNIGYRCVRSQLHARGHLFQEYRVRDSMRRVNPAAVAMRWANTVHRRRYIVKSPQALWHIDGNHRLIRYKMVIHAGIDGFSRVVVYLHVSNNNKANTVLKYFTKATDKFGIPSRVRMDRGVENVRVESYMLENRGADRGSVIKGKSVHNQRVERLWVDVTKDVTSEFQYLFNMMEENQMLDPDDDVQLFALHYVFLPRIESRLIQFQEAYNIHSLSTEHGRSPMQLWVHGILQNYNSGSTATSGVRSADISNPQRLGDNFQEDEHDRAGIVVPHIRCPLTDAELTTLKATVNPQHPNDPIGLETYHQTIQFVADCFSVENTAPS